MIEFKNGLRVMGHPMHALMVHFPMGLLITSLLWDIIGLVTSDAMWFRFSFWSIVVGLAIALLAAVPGFIDYISIGDKHPGERAALIHLSVILTGVVLFVVSILFRVNETVLVGGKLYGALGFSILGVLSLVLGGYFGAELVYKHRLGVKSE